MMTPEMIKKTYAKALAAQQAGRLDEAQKGYVRLLKANPKLAEVQFNMGRVASARQQIAEAATHFEAALRLKPQEPAIWLAYLEMASRHPNIDNLAKLLARAGAGLDRFAETTFYKGLIAARRNQPQEALTLISEALDKGLNSPRAQVERGMVQAALDDPEAALASFDAALALAPGYDFAWARKAALLRDTGRTADALEAARAAIKAAPKQGASIWAMRWPRRWRIPASPTRCSVRWIRPMRSWPRPTPMTPPPTWRRWRRGRPNGPCWPVPACRTRRNQRARHRFSSPPCRAPAPR